MLASMFPPASYEPCPHSTAPFPPNPCPSPLLHVNTSPQRFHPPTPPPAISYPQGGALKGPGPAGQGHHPVHPQVTPAGAPPRPPGAPVHVWSGWVHVGRLAPPQPCRGPVPHSAAGPRGPRHGAPPGPLRFPAREPLPASGAGAAPARATPGGPSHQSRGHSGMEHAQCAYVHVSLRRVPVLPLRQLVQVCGVARVLRRVPVLPLRQLVQVCGVRVSCVGCLCCH